METFTHPRPKAAKGVPSAANRGKNLKPALFLAIFIAFFAVFSIPMGLSNALNTMINTAYRLLVDTTLYIMAMAVVAGSVSALLAEFGVIDLLNHILSPLMAPLYGLPGASALGVVTTYLSDNPAILSLAGDRQFRRHFRAYQIPALTNLGTSFGMGLIVSTFMLGLGSGVGKGLGVAVLCGNLGTVIGSIVSTRLMVGYSKKHISEIPEISQDVGEAAKAAETTDKKSGGMRIITALMEGGKRGVELGLGIIPGVLIICTVVLMLTNSVPDGVYTGAAYEGIGIIPWIADKISFILKPLFGFSSAAGIAVPVTALGSAGAALGVIPALVANGEAFANDIAVFTAMCMCFSGYLSTHVSMMDVLKCTKFTGKAILFHSIGGIAAGISAHWLFVLARLIFKF